jgi:hypothetical protein
MTHIEDLVRSTTRALAGTVDAVRPIPELSREPSLEEVSRRRGAPERRPARRARAWLIPLAAAASVLAIVAASVTAAHLAGPAGRQGATAATARVPRPEFYMTATTPSAGPNVLQLQVRRTAGGAVTSSRSIPAANLDWGNNIAAAAGDRAFFIGYYPCRRTGVAVTTFYRITITGSGQIRGITAVGRPVQGMLTNLAVSPDGSQLAYTALPGNCGSVNPRSPALGSVSILNLSTGAVRTWQNTTVRTDATGLSWTPDGRTLVINEFSRGLGSPSLRVLALNTASNGGSLQAHSTVLLQESDDCSSDPSTSTCLVDAIPGPDGGLTALEFQEVGRRGSRMQVVSIPRAARSSWTILYSELSDLPVSPQEDRANLVADSSGQWVLLWPGVDVAGPHHQQILPAGWISGGRLHLLPGLVPTFPQSAAW